MVDRCEPIVSLAAQAGLLAVSRSSLYYEPAPVSATDKIALDAMDEIYTECPYYGSRRMRVILARDYDLPLGRDHVRRLMAVLGLQAIYPKKNLSVANPEHRIYPYLLRGVTIIRPNQVWGTDFTYVRLQQGFAYLIAFIDWFSRFVLSWALAPTMEAAIAIAALREALTRYGPPEMENSDQGSQFTSQEYINLLAVNQIKISMDGRGRCLDNIFTERLWRTVKYEDIFINSYGTIPEARVGLTDYFRRYNTRRPHQSLNYKTPAEIYFQKTLLN